MISTVLFRRRQGEDPFDRREVLWENREVLWEKAVSRAIAITKLPGLKALMRGRRLSQVADDLAINKGFLSQLISCKRGASLAMAVRLSGYLETTVEALLKAAPVSDPASEFKTGISDKACVLSVIKMAKKP